MEKIATDIYTFSEFRNGGFTYVDKTDLLYAMVSGEVGKQFFIARTIVEELVEEMPTPQIAI